MKVVEEERLILRADAESSSDSRETIIRSAWSIRDKAVQRKNLAEVELAGGRIEEMQISSQLLETVQQKVVLAQKLEEWEVDMQIMLQEQLKEKIVGSQSDSSSGSERKKNQLENKLASSSIISFFLRS